MRTIKTGIQSLKKMQKSAGACLTMPLEQASETFLKAHVVLTLSSHHVPGALIHIPESILIQRVQGIHPDNHLFGKFNIAISSRPNLDLLTTVHCLDFEISKPRGNILTSLMLETRKAWSLLCI
jgi:hypothetical protein